MRKGRGIRAAGECERLACMAAAQQRRSERGRAEGPRQAVGASSSDSAPFRSNTPARSDSVPPSTPITYCAMRAARLRGCERRSAQWSLLRHRCCCCIGSRWRLSSTRVLRCEWSLRWGSRIKQRTSSRSGGGRHRRRHRPLLLPSSLAEQPSQLQASRLIPIRDRHDQGDLVSRQRAPELDVPGATTSCSRPASGSRWSSRRW